MEFSALLFSATLLASSAFSTPVVQDSEADVMIKRQMSNVDWPHMMLERSIDDLAELSKRIVWNPKITSPQQGTKWTAGSTQKVKWETTDKPAELKNPKGVIMLGYQPADGAGGLNLKWTLARDFPLNAGTKSVTLPNDLKARDDYIIVVFGDSGNASPHFTISPAGSPEKDNFFASDLLGKDLA